MTKKRRILSSSIVLALALIIFTYFYNLSPSYFTHYNQEVKNHLSQPHSNEILAEKDIQHLPVQIQRYLRYTGAVGQPKIYNFKMTARGDIKRKVGGSWLKIICEQYDFFQPPARLFYIRSSVFGIPFEGLHQFKDGQASMKIKIASLFQIANAKGERMTQSETVTLFNDMCLYAPATLISDAIQWESIDARNVRAKFSHSGHSISAILTFNERGELINFSSDDRYLSETGKHYQRYRWHTPIKDYRKFQNRNIPSYGEAVWDLPTGPFVYARFTTTDILFNLGAIQ